MVMQTSSPRSYLQSTVRATSGQGLFRSRDFVTSDQKAPLGRILRNFRLRMRRTYFRTGHVTGVTSGHVTDVTSGHAQWFDPHRSSANVALSVPIYYLSRDNISSICKEEQPLLWNNAYVDHMMVPKLLTLQMQCGHDVIERYCPPPHCQDIEELPK